MVTTTDWPNTCALMIASKFGHTVTVRPDAGAPMGRVPGHPSKLTLALIDDHQVVAGVDLKLREQGFKLLSTGIPGNADANLHLMAGGPCLPKLDAIQDLGPIPLIDRGAYQHAVDRSRDMWDLSQRFVDEKMDLYEKYLLSRRPLVFVYGTLKRGYGNHHVMERAGGEFIREDKLQRHRMYTNGGFPMIVPGLAARCVRGELYRVQDLAPLDALEGYRQDNLEGSMYLRQEVELKSKEKVWTYVWNCETDGLDRIAGGNF